MGRAEVEIPEPGETEIFESGQTAEGEITEAFGLSEDGTHPEREKSWEPRQAEGAITEASEPTEVQGDTDTEEPGPVEELGEMEPSEGAEEE